MLWSAQLRTRMPLPQHRITADSVFSPESGVHVVDEAGEYRGRRAGGLCCKGPQGAAEATDRLAPLKLIRLAQIVIKLFRLFGARETGAGWTVGFGPLAADKLKTLVFP